MPSVPLIKSSDEKLEIPDTDKSIESVATIAPSDKSAKFVVEEKIEQQPMDTISTAKGSTVFKKNHHR